MKSRKFITIGAAVCVLGLLAVPLPASAHNPGDDHVDLRTHVLSAWWLPGAATIEVDSSASSMPSGWNDGVSSLWVWSDVDTITLYLDEGYRGRSETFIYGTDDLGEYDFDNVTSSFTLTW